MLLLPMMVVAAGCIVVGTTKADARHNNCNNKKDGISNHRIPAKFLFRIIMVVIVNMRH